MEVDKISKQIDNYFKSNPLQHYILVGDIPTPVTLEEWEKWFENFENRKIKCDHVNGFLVSTVFLGTAGILFETMSFDETKDVWESWLQVRANTREEAIAFHNELLKKKEET